MSRPQHNLGPVQDLLRFVLARLAADEKAAHEGAEGGYEWGDDTESTSPIQRHLDRHDPARALRQVAAARRTVRFCAVVIGDRDFEGFGGVKDDDPQALAVTLAMETLRDLASIHNNHPDYRKAWRNHG